MFLVEVGLAQLSLAEAASECPSGRSDLRHHGSLFVGRRTRPDVALSAVAIDPRSDVEEHPLLMASSYQFVSEWRVPGSIDEVRAVLNDADSLPRWWPSVYLAVRQLVEGGPDGLGREVDLHTKGVLPYTLRWRLLITEPITDDGFALRASGDLEGTGRWTFTQDGPEVAITYDWRVRATKPLLQRLSWLLRPFFAANHVWAMKRGEESLKLELRRRRAATPGERAKVPPPPAATFRHLLRKPTW